MASCTLEIDGRIVARAEGGPFDAEYALFEAHGIELRSNNEPGTVREHGYRTTVELALERLEGDGVTRALAAATADALGSLVAAYALGPEVRRVASLLSAGELFEGRVWNAGAKHYEGGWLDVAALAADSGVAGAARALQLLHLVTLLGELSPDAALYLSTAEYTSGRRPGERTHRRVSLSSVGDMPAAIGALAEGQAASATRAPRDGGPSRAELLAHVRGRLGASLVEPARASLEAVARVLAVRERPQRGPLADPDLWALELQLGEGDTAGAIEKIDALERSRGRQPGIAYLRARVALLLGSEDARQLAEKASALAMSMSSFAELELLAAEAWMRAGDRKRGLAYAHDLADNPQVDGVVRARARALVEPGRQSAAPVEPPPPSPPDSAPAESSPTESSPAESSPMVSITAGLRASVQPPRPPSVEPPRASPSSHGPSAPPARVASSPPIAQVAIPSERPIAPTPIVSIGLDSLPRSSPPARADSMPPSMPPASMPTRPSIPAARGPSGAPPPTSTGRTSVAPVVDERPSSRPTPSSPADDDDGPIIVRGGSRPPFFSEAPPPGFPAEPLVPRLAPDRVEKAETLSLPPGLQAESGAGVPTTPVEARVYFTHRTRELGRLYRQRHDVELRMDLRSVEIVQRHLADRFETGVLESFDDVVEVRLHAAFLSELLARRLGAEWTDLSASEMGYWAMSVPPGTTVWPIGRVLRFVTLQHRERDLVSYYLELQARAHGLK